MKTQLLAIVALVCLTLYAVVKPAHADQAALMEWAIDGEKRQALVVPPSKPGGSAVPLILVFHGHGGTMQNMERKGFQRHWPEAIVVCPQGLPTVTSLDPGGKRAGWQLRFGDNNDRDLKFVDAILKTLREKYKVDDNRIYAAGHSNGGRFTYLLGVVRREVFAAIAPSGSGARALRAPTELRPLPILHIAGEKDEVAPFENQKRTMEAVRRMNGCEPEGKPWAKAGVLVGTLYSSKDGSPFVSVIHSGGHLYPDEAPELIVKFFKENAKKTQALPRPEAMRDQEP